MAAYGAVLGFVELHCDVLVSPAEDVHAARNDLHLTVRAWTDTCALLNFLSSRLHAWFARVVLSRRIYPKSRGHWVAHLVWNTCC